MSKKRLGIAAAIVVALALAGLAINEAANAAARDELEVACGCANASVERTLSTNGDFFFRLFGEDAGDVRAFMRDEVADLCDELRDELSVGTLNLGRTWVPTADATRAEHVRGILERSRPRCVEVFAEGLGRLGVDDAQVQELCDSLFEGMEPSETPAEPPTVWAWPAAIDASMCLDDVRNARENDAERP